MGYTHYWTFKEQPTPAMWKKFLKHAATIVKASKDILAGPLGEGKPEVKGHVSFNGIGDDSHETCLFPEDPSKSPGFNCCKTARQPYDKVVVACLITLKCDCGAMVEVGSDGAIPEEWEEGKQLFEQVSGLKCTLSDVDENLRVSPIEEGSIMSRRSIILVTGHDTYKRENTIRLYKYSWFYKRNDGDPSDVFDTIHAALTRAQAQCDENNKRFKNKSTDKDAQRISVPQVVGLLIGEGTSCYGMGIRLDVEGDDPADYCEGLSTRHFGNQSDLEWIYVVNCFTKTIQVYGGGYTGEPPQNTVKLGTVSPLLEVESIREECKANYTEKISHLMTAIEARGWKINPVGTDTKKAKPAAAAKATTNAMAEMAKEYYDWPKELQSFIDNKMMPFVYTFKSDVADIAIGMGEFSRGEIVELQGKSLIKVKVDWPKLFKKDDHVFVTTAGFKKGIATAYIHDIIDGFLYIGCMSGDLIAFEKKGKK